MNQSYYLSLTAEAWLSKLTTDAGILRRNVLCLVPSKVNFCAHAASIVTRSTIYASRRWATAINDDTTHVSTEITKNTVVSSQWNLRKSLNKTAFALQVNSKFSWTPTLYMNGFNITF